MSHFQLAVCSSHELCLRESCVSFAQVTTTMVSAGVKYCYILDAGSESRRENRMNRMLWDV